MSDPHAAPNPAQQPAPASATQPEFPPPAAPVPAATPAPAPARKGMSKKLRSIAGIVVFIVVAVAVKMYLRSSGGDDATVGDCIAEGKGTALTVVACDDAKAQWKVAGIVKDIEKPGATEGKVCQAFPATETFGWRKTSGDKGDVMCLAPNSK